MSKVPLLTLGDFTIHVDVADDLDSIRFLDLVESVGLQQHIRHSPHVGGHTLDLIITRQIDRIILVDPRGTNFCQIIYQLCAFFNLRSPLLL